MSRLLFLDDPLLHPDYATVLTIDEHEQRFFVLKSGTNFWLRLEGHSDWLAIFDDRQGVLNRAYSRGTYREFEHEVAGFLGERKFARAISLRDPRGKSDEFFRVIWRGQQSFVFRPTTGEAALFKSNSEWHKATIWKRNAHFFAARLAQEWFDSHSDVRCSVDFLALNLNERKQFGLRWIRGGWGELARIGRAGAIIEHDYGERLVVLSKIVQPTDTLEDFGSNAPISGRLRRLLHRLWERNHAVVPDQKVLRRMAPCPFGFTANPARWPELHLEIAEPSGHEKLESRFILHDWTREFAPDLARDWD